MVGYQCRALLAGERTSVTCLAGLFSWVGGLRIGIVLSPVRSQRTDCRQTQNHTAITHENNVTANCTETICPGKAPSNERMRGSASMHHDEGCSLHASV